MTEQEWAAHKYHRKRGRGWKRTAAAITLTIALVILLSRRGRR